MARPIHSMTDKAYPLKMNVPELPKLELYVSSHWGSRHPQYRRHLRQQLRQIILDKEPFANPPTPSWEESILDLNQRPSHPSWSYSISHCPSLGGIALCENDYLVGLDIEERDRVKPKLLLRVSNPKEAELAPPSYIWSAKEATFKAVSSFYPQLLMSDIHIHSWTQDPESHQVAFEAQLGTISSHCLGPGLLFHRPPHVIAVLAISRLTLV